MITLKVHKSFTKDFSKIKMSGNHHAKYISYVANILNNQVLPPEAKDHSLAGKWADAREFHISGDLLVIYLINNSGLTLLRIGSHSQLF